jgi:Fic family protein
MFNPNRPHMLAKLPPKLDYKTETITDLLIKARSELGELKGYSFSMPNQLLLLSPAIIKESLASSEVENIKTTMVEVLENQLFPEAEQKIPDKEVLRYRDAILLGQEKLNKYSLSTRIILAMHKVIAPRIGGVYRKTQNGIENTHTRTIIYTPPEAAKIPDYMSNLELFMNGHVDLKADPLVRCAIAHYQFEAIHPFSDGNGRVGRMLMVLDLVQQQILNLPILYISGYINKKKSDYYRLLLEVTEKNNWYDYLFFMIKGFYMQAKETKEMVFKIMSLYYRTKKLLKTNNKKIYSADLVEALFAYPIISPVKLSNELGIHYTTASRYLEALEKADFLKSKKVGKYHLYANVNLLKIIHA